MLLMDFTELHLFLYDCKKKYGPIFTVWLPSPTVVFADYDTFVESLVTKGEDFAGRNLNFPDSFLHESPDVGLMFTEGKAWRDQRRLAIHFLKDLGMGKNIMEEKILSAIDDTIKHIDSLRDNENIDIGKILHLTVGNVITLMLFGYMHKYEDSKKFYQYVDVFDKFLLQMTNWHFKLLTCCPNLAKIPIIGEMIRGQYFKNTREIRKLTIEQINECKKIYNFNDEPQNLVHAVLKEIQTANSPYSYLTDRHIEGIVEDLWITGMETSTSTMKWLILLTMKYPDYQRRIQEEIDSVVGRDNEVRMKHKKDLPLLSAFIYEGQRYANILILGINHKCTKDNYIGGYLIKKDTRIGLFSYALNLDEQFFKNPRSFNPERYLEEDGRTLNKSLIEKNLIFGAGKRQCAGESLAKMEIFLILANLLQKYTFSHDHASIDMEPQFCSLLLPKPYHCKMEKRI
uniref:Cytochrome P450 n=1 Tax=Parastrongyloides trichosuri TaxID=131310 RepID=A0A0N5A2B5_PARTI